MTTFITIRAIYVINCKKQMQLHLSSFRLSPGILGVNMMILTALLLRNKFKLCLNAVSRLWSAVGGVLIARVTPDWKTGSLMTTYYHNVVNTMSIRGRRLCELAFCMKLLVSNKMVATYIILMLVTSFVTKWLTLKISILILLGMIINTILGLAKDSPTLLQQTVLFFSFTYYALIRRTTRKPFLMTFMKSLRMTVILVILWNLTSLAISCLIILSLMIQIFNESWGLWVAMMFTDRQVGKRKALFLETSLGRCIRNFGLMPSVINYVIWYQLYHLVTMTEVLGLMLI